jgi:hypothetical protein
MMCDDVLCCAVLWLWLWLWLWWWCSGDLGRIRECDELTRELRSERVLYRFTEPRMSPRFYPTYKRKETRKIPINLMDSDWTEDVYKCLYKEPWYKKGQVKPRVPSYCDRILIHTLPGGEWGLHSDLFSLTLPFFLLTLCLCTVLSLFGGVCCVQERVR